MKSIFRKINEMMTISSVYLSFVCVQEDLMNKPSKKGQLCNHKKNEHKEKRRTNNEMTNIL